MARVIRFENNKVFSLDTQTLVIDGKEVGKPLKGIPFRIIEYLAENQNVHISQDQIRERCWKENTGAGLVSYHIMKAREAIRDEKISGTREYKYIVECDGKYYCPFAIETYDDNDIEISKVFSDTRDGDVLLEPREEWKVNKETFITFFNNMESCLLNAILDCDCKWGACTFDSESQNTNTCEGVLAILMSTQKEVYADVVDMCIDDLLNIVQEDGLVSKSLSIATVVPTSMFLCIAKLYEAEINYNIIESLTSKLWSSRDELGWGLYMRKMGKNANIGCTYWAINGIISNDIIRVKDEDLQKVLRGLFKFENTYSFGTTIRDINPKIPCLYATSMMYILYSMLSEENRKVVDKKYDSKEALNTIVSYFDNPFFLIEEEGINGVEIGGNTSVHTVSWNHMTIHYSLLALAIGVENNQFSCDELANITKRVINVFEENGYKDGSKIYWCGPRLSLDKGNRGKLIFPTMHALMGLSYYKNAILNWNNGKVDVNDGKQKNV